MERSSTAREVLIAELLGDMGKLLDRVDTVTPAIDGACRKVTAATHELAASVTPFKVRIAEIAAQTEKKSVQDMRSAVEEATRQLLRIQTQAMNTSAREMFDQEVRPPLHQLASNLQQLIQQTRMQQTRRPWEGWATHAATATVTAILSAMLVLNVVYRSSSPAQTTGERWPRKSGHGDKWKLCANRSGVTPGKAEGP